MLTVAAAISCLLAAQPRPSHGLFDGTTPVELTITAPLHKLFTESAKDENYSVSGSLTYRDPDSGSSVVLRDIHVSVRGHTSRRDSECTFPKLKIALTAPRTLPAPFTGMSGFRIGTHCGEAPDDRLTPNGRLANQKSPPREALAYRILTVAGVPTLRARAARITYRDQGPGTGDLDGDRGPGTRDRGPGTGDRVVRNAILLEDEGAARKRVHGTSEIGVADFGNVRRRRAEADAVRVAFGEAMIGNFDWCLEFSPDDLYRCDHYKPLWNVLAFERDGGATTLLAADFDLAGVVTGRHPWLSKVYNVDFAASRSPIAIEVMSQVQRTRSLFTRAMLDAERRRLGGTARDVFAAIDAAPVDPEGRDLARAYVSTFFKDISTDDEFYRPVVSKLNEQVYADPNRSREACGPRDAIPVGTPVNELQHTASMAEVVVLDALWRWAPPRQCSAVRHGPVWLAADAISRDYPTR